MDKKPLRILDLRDSPWVDGPGRTILQTASMVDPARCEIVVGAFHGDTHGQHAYITEAKNRNLSILQIKEQKAFDREVSRQILAAIQNLSIDILHTHDFRSDLFGLWCAKKTGIPVVSTCHGWIAYDFKGKVYTAIDKFALRFFNRVITVSEVMQRQLSGLGIRRDRIEVVPNALVIDDYTPDRTDQGFRKELGVDKDTRLVANIGRLSPEKGQDIFLRAARQLLDKQNNLCFVLIGIGPQEDYLRSLAAELGIEDKIVFSGYRSDMHSIYNSLDLVVQSSYTEGMPNVILEALLMKVPVVATDVGGTAEIVSHENSGLLIRPDNLSELVNAMQDYMDKPQVHAEMASMGRDYVAENFNHNKRVSRLMEIYESLADDSMRGL